MERKMNDNAFVHFGEKQMLSIQQNAFILTFI